MEELTVLERKDQRRGRNYSIAIHIILLLLLFIFWRFPADPQDAINNQYAVAIDFSIDKSSNSTAGKEKAGARAEQKDKEEQASQKEEQPIPKVEEVKEVVKEEPIEQPVEETVEDIPVEVPEAKEVIEEESPVEMDENIPIVNEKVVVPKPAKKTPTKSTNTDAKKSTGRGTGTSNSTKKSSTTSGSGKTTSGSGSGKDKSGNDGSSGIGTGGNGNGAYDDSGDGIFGRRVIKRPISQLSRIMKEDGKIVFKSCINPYGNVSYVEIDYGSTTIKDRKLLKEALRVAEMYVYEKDLRAPDEQCGKLTISISRLGN